MMTKSFVLSGQKQEEIIYDLTSYRGPSSEHGYFKTNEWLVYRNQYPMSRENFFRQLACAATYKLEKKPKNDMVFMSAKREMNFVSGHAEKQSRIFATLHFIFAKNLQDMIYLWIARNLLLMF